MSEALKPCPFCGGEPELNYTWCDYISFDDGYWACCRNCQVRTKSFKTEQEALNSWNRRAD